VRCADTTLKTRIQANDKLLDELILEHSYNSNTIEGSTFTKRETEAVLFADKVFEDKSMTEHLELTNHARILKELFRLHHPIKVTEELIKELHYKLMTNIREDAGYYSKHHRAIRGLDLSLCHPADITDELASLINEYNSKKQKTIADIAKFHIDFELIHPFGDGNGRIGRLLMLIQCLALDLIPVIIKDKHKLDYYDTLYYAQTKHEGPFINFLFEEMEETNRLFKKYRI
jgi:DNA phosphorothioation-dependent restriction protein DptG